MLDLPIAQLPRDIVTLLMLRGADTPPLQWQNHPNRGAKTALDELDDSNLFGRVEIVSRPMAAAVRALLYLWNGCPAECAMHAQPAPEKERWYITGICERLAGRPQEAKAAFQQLDEHPIHVGLTTRALQVIGPVADPAVARFRQIMEMGQSWEAFAFVDLYEQARAGKLCRAGEQIVGDLQCKEFELLFAHCYQGATGVNLDDARPAPTTAAPRPKRKVERTHHRGSRQRESSRPTGPAKTDPQAKGALVGQAPVRVICPKCREASTFPGSARGKPVRCTKCGSAFAIPSGPGAGPAAASAAVANGGVTLICPRCEEKLTLPESARGRQEKCGKCGALFMVPRKRAVGAGAS